MIEIILLSILLFSLCFIIFLLFQFQKSQSEFKDSLNQNLDNKIKQSFELSQGAISQMYEKLESVRGETSKVANLASQIKDLNDILTNSKERGVLGEYILRDIIENVLPRGSYEFEFTFQDGTKDRADAILRLGDGKILAIDSKFPLENYRKLLKSSSPDGAERNSIEKNLIDDIKKRIAETSKYIKPKEGTLDFAFMFIPSEAIYYDILNSKFGNENLIEYALRQKKVVIVSPFTLYAYLQTIILGLRAFKIESHAKEILNNVDGLLKEFKELESRFSKIGFSLNATLNHYKDAEIKINKVNNNLNKFLDKKSNESK